MPVEDEQAIGGYVRPEPRWRGTITLCFVAACLATWVGVLRSGQPSRWIDPGPLHQAHATAFANAPAEMRCLACHDLQDVEHPAEMAHLVGLSQSQRCLACHDQHLPVQWALNPHSMSAEQLDSANPRQLECSRCHQEHHGSKHELTRFSDAQCHVCHERQFARFADHPEFDPPAVADRRAIAFNHEAHAKLHFPARQRAEFDCQACHATDQPGQVTSRAGFSACADCHLPALETSFADGLPLLTLPMLDVDALQEARLPVGEWPEAANGDFDGRLPPIMVALLAADVELREFWLRFGLDFDLIDVDRDRPEDLKAVQQLALAIKRLMADVAARGREAVQDRLAASVPGPGESSRRTVAEAMASAPFAETFVEWFPEEAAEQVSARNSGASSAREAATLITGLWRRDDATLTLAYSPSGHADRYLQAWYELLHSAAGPADAANAASATNAIAQNRASVVANADDTIVSGSESIDALRTLLSSGTGAGQCATCHQAAVDTSRRLQWTTGLAARPAWPLTRFDHRPHLAHPPLRECVACHRLADTGSLAGTSEQLAPFRASLGATGLAAISKQSCVGCHHLQAAGESCAQCHDYHQRAWHAP